jgi:hypothetical protein
MTAVLALSSYGWIRWIDIAPDFGVPRVKLPTPNAFETYMRAGTEVANDKEIDPTDASAPPILPPPFIVERVQTGYYALTEAPSPRNHVAELGGMVSLPNGLHGPQFQGVITTDARAAFEPDRAPEYVRNMVDLQKPQDWNLGSHRLVGFEIRPPGRFVALDLQERLLKDNAAALRMARTGLSLPYMQPPLRAFENSGFAYMDRVRKLSRLFDIQMRLQAFHQDWNGAVQTGLDGMMLASQLPNGGTTAARLNSFSIESMFRKQIWRIIPRLTASEARAAARRVEVVLWLHVPFDKTVEASKWAGVQEIANLFRQPHWRTAITGIDQAIPGSSGQNQNLTGQEIEQLLTLLRFSKQEIVNAYMTRMDEECIRATRPFSRDLAPQPEPADAMNQMFARDFNGIRFTDMARCVLQDRFLLAGLALQAYKQEHGSYPTKLKALVPGYLSETPQDPFAPNNPLRYRPMPNRGSQEQDVDRLGLDPVELPGYVLYSVGPDRVDNDGMAIQHPRHPLSAGDQADHQSPSARFEVAPDNDGDIVAGINF